MREIKFRCWDGKRFHEWGYIDPYEVGTIFVSPPSPLYPSQQYIGIKDKNGKEVCEGDLIKGEKTYIGNYGQHRTKGFLGTVEFGGSSFRIKLLTQAIINRFGGSLYVFFSWSDENYEVVGNIFEHTQLLETLKS